MIPGDQGCECWKFFEYCDAYNNVTESIIDVVLGGETIEYSFLWSSGNEVVPWHVDWHVQNGCIVIENLNMDGQSVTIQYYGYETDPEGIPYVYDTNIEAIASGLKLFLAKKEQWRSFKRLKLTSNESTYISQLKIEYNQDVRHARAEWAKSNSPDNDHISAFLNNPMSGKGNIYLDGAY